MIRPQIKIFPLNDEPTMYITFNVHIPNARDISCIKDIRSVGFDIQKGVGERLKELSLEKGNIGIVGPLNNWFKISIPAEHRDYLKETFPQANFRVVTNWYEYLRLVKSEEEIQRMERAAAINDVCQEEVILATKPGIRHSELAAIVNITSTRLGGNYAICNLSSTPMSNPQMVYPDPLPTHKVVATGDVVMTENAVGRGAYYAMMFATWFVGEPTEEYRNLFGLAASVYENALKELKPGMAGDDADRLVAPIKEAGYITRTPLVAGWSTYNTEPHLGLPKGMKGYHGDESPQDFVFKPGHCVRINVCPLTPDMKKGVWLGSACVFTKDGLRSFHRYPVTELRVV